MSHQVFPSAPITVYLLFNFTFGLKIIFVMLSKTQISNNKEQERQLRLSVFRKR